jgi:hypothetical protein
MINSVLPTLGKVFTPANIMSNLDNPSSLWLVGAKDSVDVFGRTTMAYKEGSKHSKESGAHEARERLIEEVGTSVVWLGGIPFCRWAFDKAASVIPGLKEINPNISLKKVTSEGVQGFSHGLSNEQITKALEYAKKGGNHDSIVKMLGTNAEKFIELGSSLIKKEGATADEILKAGLKVLDKSKYSQFHIAKLLVSTIIPFGILAVALPRFNQGLTKKLIEEKKEKDQKANLASQSLQGGGGISKSNKNTSFAAFIETHSKKQLSFGGIGSLLAKAAAGAQINPVENMMAVDLSISGSRIINGRNKDEKAEIFLREGGIVFFYFCATELIKNGLNSIAEKGLKLPIDLDFKLLGDKGLISQVAKDKKFLNSFTKDHSEKGVIDFINKQIKNGELTDLTLKAAQKLGFVDIVTLNGKKMINPTKFIETEKIIKLSKNLEKFAQKAAASAGNEKAFNALLSKTKTLKGSMTVLNMVLCSFSLGYLLPKIQYLYREHKTGTSLSPGLKAYADNSTEKQQNKKLQAFS